jgi:hypothetical protein
LLRLFVEGRSKIGGFSTDIDISFIELDLSKIINKS